jgi:hypothetical protein
VSGATGGNFDFTLHRLTRHWGEGSSSGTGTGSMATPGDATWLQSEFGSQSWTTEGGDFVETASATASVGGIAFYDWNSAGLAADVQSWVNQSADHFGWLLRGDESTPSAKVFTSRHGANGPQLAVSYRPAPPRSHREIWHDQFFTVGQFVDPEGDADADRIPALLEYAWDSDPATPDSPADFMSVVISPTNAAVVFRRDPRALDLEYRLETSDNLTSWAPVVTATAGATPSGSAYVSEGEDPANPETLQVTASIPLSPGSVPKLFVRLLVRRL